MNPQRAEPASPVYSMGNLQNVWRHFLKDGVPQALGFFALGDAAVRTNPLYGRGCSSGVVEAHLLRAALDATPDPAERARLYDRDITKTIRPYFKSMVTLDLQAIRRAKHERDPDYKPGLRARIMKSFTEDGLLPAQRGDVEVARALTRIFHMLDEPQTLLKRPASGRCRSAGRKPAISIPRNSDPNAPKCSRVWASPLNGDTRWSTFPLPP
jgi:hypothetical protein